ncbi:cell division protein FtsA, partial [candidate division WWE3 bacterium]|nr:cell division protein FtsA [candidate division WWE3 bacterium]
MAREKIITGIDVGSTKVSTVVANVSDGRVSVIGVSNVPSSGIKRGVVVDIDEAVEAIDQSLERAQRMAGVSIQSAFVTVSGSHVESLNSHGVVAVSHQGVEIGPDDISRVTEAAQAISLPSSREIIHVIPRDFIVDGQNGIKDPTGMSGVRLEVETNVITGMTTSMRNLVKCVSQVGVEVDDLVFTGIAASESVLTDTERELGAILVDLGGGTTSIVIFAEGSPVYSSVLPIGGQHVTSDLAIGLRASMESAEKIKIKLSLERDKKATITEKKPDDIDVSEFNLETETVPKKLLYEIIDARLTEIFTLIALEIRKANLSGKLPAGLVITGGSALTCGIEKIAKGVLKIPVRAGFPRGVTGLIDEIEGPSFSANVGVILYGSHLYRTKNTGLSFNSHQGK